MLLMSENRCTTNCEIYRRCASGELGELATEMFTAETVRIDASLDSSEDIKQLRHELNKLDTDMTHTSIKRVTEVAEGGKCRGPTFFTKTCRNPYAKAMPENKGSF